MSTQMLGADMRIQFDLPDGAASMLKMLAHCIERGTGEQPTPAELCRSLVIEILVDDAAAHGLLEPENPGPRQHH